MGMDTMAAYAAAKERVLGRAATREWCART